MRNKVNELEAVLHNMKPTIVCITEHWLKKEEVSTLSLADYKLESFSARNVYLGGGTAIFVNKKFVNNINIKTLDFLNNLNVEKCIEICGIFIENFNLYVLNVYRSPSGCFADFMAAMESVLNSVGVEKHIIVTGDFNVHLETTQMQGIYMTDLFESFGLRQTIFSSTRGDACIDNIFVGHCLDVSCAQSIELDLSDHLGQKISVLANFPTPQVKHEWKVCRPITQAGLLSFYDLMTEASWAFLDVEGLDADCKASEFVGILEWAYLASFPNKSYRVRSDQGENITWFNNELRAMREHLALLGELSRQYAGAGSKQEYNSYKRTYKKALKDARIQTNDRLIQSSDNPSKCMWSIINSNRGVTKNKNESGNIAPNIFNNFFVNVAHNLAKKIPSYDQDPTDLIKNINPPIEIFSFREVTFIEIRDCLLNLKNKNSKDIFGLNVKLLKSIKHLIVIPLTKLVNLCIRDSVFPDILKKALVTPIFKKGCLDSPENYRPISLLPVLSKILEKCMARQIIEYFNLNKYFTDCQFGFRKNRNTTMGIIDLTSYILDSFNDQQFTSSVFCDLSKAFDCVSHDILLRKLRAYHFNENSIKFLASYLTGRVQTVRVQGVDSAESGITIGVPQGSILGPLLFLIYINDLPLLEPSAKFTLFADDTTISATASSLEDALGIAERLQADAERWFGVNGLHLNVDKTNRVIFSMRDTGVTSGDMQYVKFLGVHLDARMQWGIHIDIISKSLKSCLFVLRSLAQCVSYASMRLAYFGLFHCKLSYAILAWGHSTHADRVFGLQRKAVRLISGLGFRDDCKEAFITQRILTLPSLYMLECMLYVRKNVDVYLSHSDVHGHDTRHRHNLVPGYCRIGRTRDGPGYYGPKLFNRLPVAVRELPLEQFRGEVTKILINNAFYSISDFLKA